MSNIFSSEKKEISAPLSFAESVCSVTENLTYMSETDAPIEVFSVPFRPEKDLAETLRGLTADNSGPVTESSFDDLFSRLTRVHDGANETAIRRASRFAELEKLLRSSLSDLSVVRIGSVRVDLFIVGFDDQGNLSGVRTFAVET